MLPVSVRLKSRIIFPLLLSSLLTQQFESSENNLKRSFLEEFMKRRKEIFPFSFDAQINKVRSEYQNGSLSSINVLQKEKLKKFIVENPIIQTAIHHHIKHKLQISEYETKHIIRNLLRKYNISGDNLMSRQDDFLKPTSNFSDSSSHFNILNLQRLKKRKISPGSNSQRNVSQDVNGTQNVILNQTLNPSTSSERPNEDDDTRISFLAYILNILTQLPIIGSILRASMNSWYGPLDTIVNNQEGATTGDSWCFEGLGCLDNEGFFHPLYRPINLVPYFREQINTRYIIYSRNDSEGTTVAAHNLEEVMDTNFEPENPIKFIIHGFVNSPDETWILDMVRALLKHGDYNVIVIDWSDGSHALYSQATSNLRVVALETINFINWLTSSFDIKPSSIHLIGHSLGAHLAGNVGAGVDGIARITGLDPAEPSFQHMPNVVRLDPTDAKFVDVIHTDMDSFFAITGPRGFGLEQQVGHLDFYPNGGREQPGCNQLITTLPITLISEGQDIVEGMSAAQRDLLNCNHVRAPKLFTDSIISSCPYLSFACSSYKKYKEGKCFSCGEGGELCASMGINADEWLLVGQSPVKMFLETHSSPQFCKYHYLLTLNFGDPLFSTGSVRGRLKISLITENGDIKKFDLTALSPVKFPRKGSATFMLEHFEDLSRSREALLHWTFEPDILNPLTFCILFCTAELNIVSVKLASVDTKSAADKVAAMRSGALEWNEEATFDGGEVVMCHPGGKTLVLTSQSTVKISSSPLCG